MLVKKERLVNFLIAIYFVFFSLPMVFICGFPWRHKWCWMYGIEYLNALLYALIPISPWALLVMAIICYKKELKLQAYVATALFFWAALIELFVILFIQILELRPFPPSLFLNYIVLIIIPTINCKLFFL